ncbi:unnamed protein product, partial [Linum tenue]
ILALITIRRIISTIHFSKTPKPNCNLHQPTTCSSTIEASVGQIMGFPEIIPMEGEPAPDLGVELGRHQPPQNIGSGPDGEGQVERDGDSAHVGEGIRQHRHTAVHRDLARVDD